MGRDEEGKRGRERIDTVKCSSILVLTSAKEDSESPEKRLLYAS